MLTHLFAMKLKGKITEPRNKVAVIYKYFVVKGQFILIIILKEVKSLLRLRQNHGRQKIKSLNGEMRSHRPFYISILESKV